MPTVTRLTAWKLHADQQIQDDANPKERGWFSNLLTGPSSSIALAFLCNKALLPVRAPVTIGLTPMVARYSTPVPTEYIVIRNAIGHARAYKVTKGTL